jgi:hypothetical protein
MTKYWMSIAALLVVMPGFNLAAEADKNTVRMWIEEALKGHFFGRFTPVDLSPDGQKVAFTRFPFQLVLCWRNEGLS